MDAHAAPFMMFFLTTDSGGSLFTTPNFYRTTSDRKQQQGRVVNQAYPHPPSGSVSLRKLPCSQSQHAAGRVEAHLALAVDSCASPHRRETQSG